MNSFRYIHKDGRTGEAWSAWAAIVAALGPAEGNQMIDQQPRDPTFRPENGPRYHARAVVELESGESIGELFKLI